MTTQTAVAGRLAAVAQSRPASAGAWLLSGAMVVSGVLAYVFHVLAARTLGAEAYGQIAVLWAAMFLAAIVLFRPLEQTISRTVAERLTRGEEVKTVLRSVGVICAAVLVVCGVATALAWTPITERLFVGDDALTWMLLVGTGAYGFAYLVRGLLGGVRWFSGYGLGLIADAVGRLIVAAPLVLIASEGLAASAMVVAGLAGGIVPLLVGRRFLSSIVVSRSGARFRLASALAFAAPASIIAAADQLFVNGAPLLVMAEGAADASKTAGIVFAATMLVRAPVYVFQGLAASLLPNLTHIHAVEGNERLRLAVVKTTGILLLVGALIVAITAAIGPESMSLLYGDGFEVARVDLTLLGVGVAFYLAASTFSQAHLALDGGTHAAIAWTTSAMLFVTLFFVLPGDDLARISLSFALATLAASLLLGFALARRIR